MRPWTHMNRVQTDVLDIAFEEGGPPAGFPVLLLHGWPDAPRGWTEVSHRLHASGYRTVAPYLRGSHPTRFLSNETPRVGAGVALAQDAMDLMNALDLSRVAVVGHDWGAREAYMLAALNPERVSAIAALSLGYQPRGSFSVPSFDQSRRFWYQWFMCTDGGADAVRADPVGFARLQWETWSPSTGWFDDDEFARTAASFTGPDWVAITLNAYRARWRPGEAWDARYDAPQRRLSDVERLATPTLMIQGLVDDCVAPRTSDGADAFFTAGYRRLLLEHVGHFPHREAPAQVADAVIEHLRQSGLP